MELDETTAHVSGKRQNSVKVSLNNATREIWRLATRESSFLRRRCDQIGHAVKTRKSIANQQKSKPKMNRELHLVSRSDAGSSLTVWLGCTGFYRVQLDFTEYLAWFQIIFVAESGSRSEPRNGWGRHATFPCSSRGEPNQAGPAARDTSPSKLGRKTR